MVEVNAAIHHSLIMPWPPCGAEKRRERTIKGQDLERVCFASDRDVNAAKDVLRLGHRALAGRVSASSVSTSAATEGRGLSAGRPLTLPAS